MIPKVKQSSQEQLSLARLDYEFDLRTHPHEIVNVRVNTKFQGTLQYTKYNL